MLVGLEVHAELSTRTKMYCACENAFGGEPNTRVCPVCTGAPGALPSLNRQAVRYAVLAARALGCQINRKTRQYRKQYFYPDLPKGYQISQLDIPLGVNGEFMGAKIRQVHIEEDAGKLVHEGDITLADYNRCGVPLIEIVTEPCFTDSNHVYTFLTELRRLLLFIGVCDCKMQEGSIRCDVNVSTRGERVEMKNVNTFSGVVRCIEYEVSRQNALHGEIMRETRRWDDEKRCSYLMRDKENAADYRYFPEPDIPSITIDEPFEPLCELPRERELRYIRDFALPEFEAAEITKTPQLSEYFDKCVTISKYALECARLILSEKERIFDLEPAAIADAASAICENKINRTSCKKIFNELRKNCGTVADAIEKLSLKVISDSDELSDVVAGVLRECAGALSDYKNGKKNALSFLVGQCMRRTGGTANPGVITNLIIKELENDIQN